MQKMLQRQLFILLGVSTLLIVALSQTTLTLLSLAVIFVVWLWHWSVIWRSSAENRPNLTTPLNPTFGTANWMSITRGFLNSVLFGFVIAVPTEANWVPAILYTISALLDIFDGLVARLTKQQTMLGEKLDLEYDGAGVLIVVAVALRFGQLPWWFWLIGLARYLYLWGIAWRERRQLPIHPTPESHNRRVTAGLMMAYLTVILWPLVDTRSANVAAYVFGIPFLLGFLRDWLILIGWVGVDQASYRQGRVVYKQFTEVWLPQFGRITAFILILTGLLTLDLTTVFAWFGLIGLVMIGLGIIARLGAIFLVVFAVLGNAAAVPSLILLVSALVIIQYGLRCFSLWVPEERIFAGRLG
ncbi:MAG: CDP-alcohol phosphatidyltransferase family protein [Candidatus Promineifilaceae bacterium]